jgi:DNA-binding CsgD family transcriptional regulator
VATLVRDCLPALVKTEALKAQEGQPLEWLFVVTERQGEVAQEVVSVERYEIIRLRCVRDGEPIKRVARELDLAPNTVRKYVREMGAPKPPRYQRRTRLDRFTAAIDTLLQPTPRITVKRVGVVLREQHDAELCVSPSQLRKVVADRRR